MAIKNITECLLRLSPNLVRNKDKVQEELSKQVRLVDFNEVSNKELENYRIIVNPPYKETKRNNLWIPIIEKLVDSKISAITLIVPVAIASSKRTQYLRTQIFKRFEKVSAFHHEIRPRSLFHGVDQRIGIITAISGSSLQNEYLTTGFLKHRSGERTLMWRAPMTILKKSECKNIFPKVSPEDYLFFKEFESCKNRVTLASVAVTNKFAKEVWVRTTGRYHLTAQYTKPTEISSKWKKIIVSEKVASQFLQAFQDGDLLKWWRIFGDGRDISISSLYNEYGIRL